MIPIFPVLLAPNFPELESRWNGIPDALFANARDMLALAEQARTAGGDVPVRVNSWYRTLAQNIAARGSSTSQHLTASAMDLSPESDPEQWFRRLASLLPPSSFGQLIYYRATSRHVHLSLPNRTSGRTGEVLIETAPGRYTTATGNTVPAAALLEGREGLHLSTTTLVYLVVITLGFLVILGYL